MALPHSRSRDDADEEDPTPAERVARGEHENVLEEERVQLCELPGKKWTNNKVGLLLEVVVKSLQDGFL